MADVMLIASEEFVKDVSSISDNLTPKYLRPSIQYAQEVKLRQIVGDSLLAKLKEVATRSNEGKTTAKDAPYLDALSRARYVVAYYAIAHVLPRISYKVTNSGMITTSSEGVQQATLGEVGWVMQNYIQDGDSATRELQKYLIQNRTKFKELDDCACASIRSQLHSSATCGLFLGGRRGQVLGGRKFPTTKGGCR